MEKCHAPIHHAEDDPTDLSIRQVAANFPETFAKAATVGHAHRPTEFDLLHVPPNELPVFGRQALDPVPHGFVATRRLIKERR